VSTTFLTVWTLALAAAIVLVLASYLIGVAVRLYQTSRHLAELAAGLVQVRTNAGPLEQRLATISGALSALADELERVDTNLKATGEALGE
jgi:hypothetical protein